MISTDAANKATNLLKKEGIEKLPVPVEAIARNLGAEIVYEPFKGDVSGMLVRRDDGHSIIGVNSTHSNTRQRFTVAHEIAHLLLHKGKPTFVDSFVRLNLRNGDSTQEEMEANAFAAELLMPHGFVHAQIEDLTQKYPSMARGELQQRLAKSFKVSAEAMGYRLKNLGIFGPLDFDPN